MKCWKVKPTTLISNCVSHKAFQSVNGIWGDIKFQDLKNSIQMVQVKIEPIKPLASPILFIKIFLLITLAEEECLKRLREFGRLNQVWRSYIGLGYYNTIVPPTILRNLLENPGWYNNFARIKFYNENNTQKLNSIVDKWSSRLDIDKTNRPENWNIIYQQSFDMEFRFHHQTTEPIKYYSIQF